MCFWGNEKKTAAALKKFLEAPERNEVVQVCISGAFALLSFQKLLFFGNDLAFLRRFTVLLNVITDFSG